MSLQGSGDEYLLCQGEENEEQLKGGTGKKVGGVEIGIRLVTLHASEFVEGFLNGRTHIIRTPNTVNHKFAKEKKVPCFLLAAPLTRGSRTGRRQRSGYNACMHANLSAFLASLL